MKSAKNTKVFSTAEKANPFVPFVSFVVFLPICEFWDKFADKFGLTPLTGRAHPGYN